MSFRVPGWLYAVPLIVTSCVLAPPGTDDLRRELAAAGEAWHLPYEDRQLPELSATPDWRAVLERAFLANGELEAAYYDWHAAVSRIDVAAGYPNTDLALNFSYLFSGERMKAWDRATLAIGFNPMQNLAFPNKVSTAGRIAFSEAQAAASRLRRRKFDLQQQVLRAYFELVLVVEQQRLRRDMLAVLQLALETTRGRVALGATPQEAAALAVDVARERDALEGLASELGQRRAALNALVARAPDASLDPPPGLPEARPLRFDDEALLAVGVAHNPDLAELQRAHDGRQAALHLARLQYLPDINPMAGIRGGAEQMAGVMIMFATTIPQIRARIAAAEAELHGSEAALRQAAHDRAAAFAATLLSLRNQERQVRLFTADIVPLAELSAVLARQAYVAGSASLAQWLEGRLVVLEAQRGLAEARVAREIRLAELESLAGIDFESLAAAAPAEMTQEVRP